MIKLGNKYKELNLVVKRKQSIKISYNNGEKEI